MVLTACQPFTTTLVASNPKWFRHEWIWDKGRTTGFLDANRKPLRKHESVLVFSPRRPRYRPQFGSGRPYRSRRPARAIETIGEKRVLMRESVTINHGRRYPTSILSIPDPNGKGKVHPTQKPVELMAYLVRTYTDPGMTVLDPTMGVGSTGVACRETGRRFIGIERDPGYFAIAERRIAEAQAA